MRRKAELDAIRTPLGAARKNDVANRLKSARGHLDAVIAQLDEYPLAIDLIRQIAAVRGALDATMRVALRHYFDHVFVAAVKAGKSKPAVDELMSVLTFLRQLE